MKYVAEQLNKYDRIQNLLQFRMSNTHLIHVACLRMCRILYLFWFDKTRKPVTCHTIWREAGGDGEKSTWQAQLVFHSCPRHKCRTLRKHVLFYFYVVCIHVCANAFKFKVHCGSALGPGAFFLFFLLGKPPRS